GAAARAAPAPEGRSAQAAKDAGHAGESLYGVRERGCHAPRPQEAAQSVLVLAELDHRSRGKERATRKPAPGAGERPHLLVGGGNDQVDADMIEHAPQVAPEDAIGHRTHEEVPVRRGLLQDEAIAVTARDDQGRSARLQAPDQIVARSAAAPGVATAARHLSARI